MTRIVINGGGFANKGAEAMLLTARDQLRSRLGEVEFTAWHIPAAESDDARRAGLLPVTPPPAARRWTRMRGGRRVARVIQEIYVDRSLGGFDALVDVSGFAYGDLWGLGSVRRIAPLMSYCRAHRRPAFFLPQAWGSFTREPVARAVSRLLRSPYSRFYPRDDASSRHLESLLDMAPGVLTTHPDIAFLFDEGSESEGRRILGQMGCTCSRPIVGLAPNLHAQRLAELHDSTDRYLGTFVSLARHCIDDLGADVVLQANRSRRDLDGADDRQLCRSVWAAVERPDRCFFTDDPSNAPEARSVLGCTDLVVGSRYHALIFALSQGIPCMGISWSHKYMELFHQLGMGEYVYSIDDLRPESVTEVFDRAWTTRERLSEAITAQVLSYRSDLSALFDRVAAEIRQVVEP